MQLTKKKAITVAAAMTLTAALTGGTLALWNDQASLGFDADHAAQIQSGSLSLDLLREDVQFAEARDHSALIQGELVDGVPTHSISGVLIAGDVEDGIVIDLDSFIFSPGDVVQIDLATASTEDALVELNGTNLVATLEFEFVPDFYVVDEDGVRTDIDSPWDFRLLINGADATAGPVPVTEASVLTLEVSFDAAGQDHFQSSFGDLIGTGIVLNATLQQVR